MKTSAMRWVIVGNCGLYVGQWLTRSDAIARHIHDKLHGSKGFPRLSEFAGAYGALDPTQKRAWKVCQRLGDRAIKARIIWGQEDEERWAA